MIAQQGHYPFWETWYQGAGSTKWQFTTYERDAESSLDYAIFRYDSSRLGRFMTPDSIAGSIIDPQSLNRYAYVRNDPDNLVDPLGLRMVQETSPFRAFFMGLIGAAGWGPYCTAACHSERSPKGGVKPACGRQESLPAQSSGLFR